MAARRFYPTPRGPVFAAFGAIAESGSPYLPAVQAQMRLRFRYRLRTLLLAMAALALPLRWWGLHASHDREFGERVAAIEKYGGQVVFGFSEGSLSLDEKLWLFLGGDDRPGMPAHVWISKGNLNDEHFSQLDIGGFPNLEDLLLMAARSATEA